jgi:Mn-dependent DtxR family transcriptional regulator
MVQISISVLDYLKKIYPRAATEGEIEQEAQVSGCTCGKAIKSLTARGSIEIAGKKGNANLYKYKPAE